MPGVRRQILVIRIRDCPIEKGGREHKHFKLNVPHIDSIRDGRTLKLDDGKDFEIDGLHDGMEGETKQLGVRFFLYNRMVSIPSHDVRYHQSKRGEDRVEMSRTEAEHEFFAQMRNALKKSPEEAKRMSEAYLATANNPHRMKMTMKYGIILKVIWWRGEWSWVSDYHSSDLRLDNGVKKDLAASLVSEWPVAEEIDEPLGEIGVIDEFVAMDKDQKNDMWTSPLVEVTQSEVERKKIVSEIFDIIAKRNKLIEDVEYLMENLDAQGHLMEA